MKKARKYVSPVGKHVVLQLNDKVLGKGLVLHQSAHLVTLQCGDQIQWYGWGPGMVMADIGNRGSVEPADKPEPIEVEGRVSLGEDGSWR